MKKVLVVDDSPTIRQQVGMALGKEGFSVLEASDGVEALAMIELDRQINLVILDVNMPRMNGLEMLEKAKANPKNAALPVIILTTEGQHSLIQRAKAAGAKAWIVKPFNPTLLVGAIKKVLGVG